MNSGPLVLDLPTVRSRLEARFRVYDVQVEEHVLAFYVDAPRDTLEAEFNALKQELKEMGLVPLLKYQGGEHAIYVLRNPMRARRGWKLNLTLFLVTLATTTVAGSFSAYLYYQRDVPLGEMYWSEYLAQVVSVPWLGMGFLTFALPLMLILTVHEFGHYWMARRHGMEASLPFFIPVPPVLGLNIGTFGAFISMREPMPNRKALFDIGAAGPIAGFAVAVPVILVGFWLMTLGPVHPDFETERTFTIGTPLLYDLLALPFGISDDLLVHPTAFAGWVGLFVTAINLLPAGQLDGGHVASAMFGDRARYASYSAVAALLVLGLAAHFPPVPLPGGGAWSLPGYDGWLVFALLIGFLGVRHPPTLDSVSGIDRRRMLVGWLTFAMGVLCFTVVPVSG